MMAILKYSVQVKAVKKMFLKYTRTGAMKGLIFQLSSPKKFYKANPSYLFPWGAKSTLAANESINRFCEIIF